MSAAVQPSVQREDHVADLHGTSRAIFFLGLIELVIFGAATFAVTRATTMSIAELQSITGGNLSRDQLQAIHPHLKSFAILLALCGVVPAAAYLVCAQGIRRGLPVALVVAMLLAGTQLFVLGGVLIRQVLVALASGSPPTLTVSVLALGTPMAFLIVILRLLLRHSRRRTDATISPA